VTLIGSASEWGNQQQWGQMWCEYCGDGIRSCGNSAWMAFVNGEGNFLPYSVALEIMMTLKTQVQVLEY